MVEISDLENQIESTLDTLELKQKTAQEEIVNSFIDKYKNVQAIIQAGNSKDEIVKKAKALLGAARGYLETSSDYQQDFLNEMSKTEKLIKQL